MGEAENRAELVTKISALAKRRGETPEQLFRSYDSNRDTELSAPELRQLLTDANVGNTLTRSTWVSRIFTAIDADRSGRLSWPELQAIIASGTPPPPPATRNGPPTLTRAQAAEIARRIFSGNGAFDASGYNAADLALIEEESIRLGREADRPAPRTQRTYGTAALLGVAGITAVVLTVLAVRR